MLTMAIPHVGARTSVLDFFFAVFRALPQATSDASASLLSSWNV